MGVEIAPGFSIGVAATTGVSVAGGWAGGGAGERKPQLNNFRASSALSLAVFKGYEYPKGSYLMIEDGRAK